MNAKGAAEFVNSLVCSACVSWHEPCDPILKQKANELVFPPREIQSCDAKQIFRGIVDNFEKYAFGCDCGTFVKEAARAFGSMTVCAVGDSATANLKGIFQFFSLLADLGHQHGITLTSVYTPCFIHQYSRIMLLHLEQQDISSPLYSLSRLHKMSSTRKTTCAAMKQLLLDRFEYKENSFPPRIPSTSASFRKHLAQLLTGRWDDPSDFRDDDREASLVRECLKFFNDDLTNPNKLVHHCSGPECHSSKQHALQHVSWRQASKVGVS